MRAARVADGDLALLTCRRRLLDAQPVRPGRGLAGVGEHERPEELDCVRVDLRLPARERRAEVEIAGAGRCARLVLPLALLAAGLAFGIVVTGGRPLLASGALSLRVGGQ